MNYIWSMMVAASLIFGVIKGNAAEVLLAGLDGASLAITTLLGFAGMMCFWQGILSIAKEGEISKYIKKFMSPLINALFGKDNSYQDYIAMNITANLLGMGNAATPAGIMAMQEMDKENKSEKPNRKMAVFAVMNTSSIQIIPTTVIALRQSAGSAKPFDIIACVWISSLLGLLASLLVACTIKRR